MLASVLLISSAAIAQALVPHIRLAEKNGVINLETMVPKKFGTWHIDPRQLASVVNPQTEQLLKATYNQILTRTYINDQGTRMMLSIAYGEDQTDSGNEVHHPEICYPAQGFQLRSQQRDQVPTPFGNLPVNRLETKLGTQRNEPVTYWITIGNRIALTGYEKKMAELSHGLQGEIVDGLLFRVSSIDANSKIAFANHDTFITELLQASTQEARARLIGSR
jgi:EpsI family protein